MSLKDTVSSDFLNSILNTNEFAEAVTFKPSVGAQKSIKAVIFREQISPLDVTAGRGLSKICRIVISSDSTLGISSVNKGSDKISFPEYPGGTSVDWLVHRISGGSFGVWDLEVIK